MDLSAKITGIKYKPLLCAELKTYTFKDLQNALSKNSTFILNMNKENKVAVSQWVSPKRTRSYPFARVYDTLRFSGKKITIIPVVKDEGKDGDRDFLQWDTVSLMSLLGIYVVIGYYTDARQSTRYRNKITHQRFDTAHIKRKINKILSYQSDALHWNLAQIDKIDIYGKKALERYDKISKKTGVTMHSKASFEKRIKQLQGEKEKFMTFSRQLAKEAQQRESITTQPKEHLSGIKGTITIKNYLGGLYHLTSDEVEIKGQSVYLIEAKHTKGASPSIGDIKDGLIKMILFTNLKEVKVGGKKYNTKPVLKLTSEKDLDPKNLNVAKKSQLDLLKKEAKTNEFEIEMYNVRKKTYKKP